MYVVGTIDKGTRPARIVRKQRRLSLKDVLAYEIDNRPNRHQTLRELAVLDQELGVEQLERLRSSPFLDGCVKQVRPPENAICCHP